MPRPDFTLEDETCWAANTRFESWAGFQSRRGPYGSIDSTEPSDGLVRVVFAPEGRGPEPLDPREHALVDWLFENESQLSEAVQQIIFAAYPAIRSRLANDGGLDNNEIPEIQSISDL